MYSSLENDTDFYDDFQDISSGEKRIVRVGTKSFDKTGTYITVKLYKKNEDGVFKCYQAVTLTTREFDCLADNYSKIKKLVKKQTGEKTSCLVLYVVYNPWGSRLPLPGHAVFLCLATFVFVMRIPQSGHVVLASVLALLRVIVSCLLKQ